MASIHSMMTKWRIAERKGVKENENVIPEIVDDAIAAVCRTVCALRSLCDPISSRPVILITEIMIITECSAQKTISTKNRSQIKAARTIQPFHSRSRIASRSSCTPLKQDTSIGESFREQREKRRTLNQAVISGLERVEHV